MVALTFAFAGALASPAAAQNVSIGAVCQVTEAGQIANTDCTLAFNEATGQCTVNFDGRTVQFINGCATIQQGECPLQIVTTNPTQIIQIICDGKTLPTPVTPGVTPTPVTPGVTPTPVTPGVTPTVDVPPMATPVIPGVTPTVDVPPMVTPVISGVTPTATPTDVVPPGDDDDDVVPPGDDDVVPPGDDDVVPPADDVVPPADDTTDDVVVDALPSTGQGPTDTNQSGILVAMLGAMSALLAGAALLWQRRGLA
jgi:hypothetical protein